MRASVIAQNLSTRNRATCESSRQMRPPRVMRSSTSLARLSASGLMRWQTGALAFT